MTQDEIIEMAKEAGLEVDGVFFSDRMYREVLVRFAKLVADKATAKEREALAKTHETTLKEFNQQIHDDPNYHIWVKEREDRFKPELDALQVLANENQRMAKRIEELEALAQEQEPVAWEQFHEHMAGPFYQKPPQRTWVGLTEDERQEIALEVPIDAVSITEAKLKEKNCL